MNPTFWQYLLSGSLPAHKVWGVLDEIRDGGLDPVSTLLSSRGLSEAERKRMKAADMRALERGLAAGGKLLEDPTYEGGVEEREFPPVLFAMGDTSCLNAPKVAIVGTRQASPYGRAAARKFAANLADAGVTIVSGGAFGIDTNAHEGALEVGGKTVSVLPTGVDVVYPASNAQLFDRIKTTGCLISQFGMGQKATDYSFLFRNTIIAAISHAVILIEAPAQSGALHTAMAAIEQGKEVFVVPGPITSMSFNGSHGLIRDGATLVFHPGQILEVLGIAPAAKKVARVDAEEGIQAAIMDVLSETPITAEEIGTKLSVDPTEILGELTMLEMEGLVLREGIGYALNP
ncbi:MAG: DNA-processing protein DprA [Armatimonadetes bacterium]|nr:DNA-processing protein DprA [Armatimonadota bacterium]